MLFFVFSFGVEHRLPLHFFDNFLHCIGQQFFFEMITSKTKKATLVTNSIGRTSIPFANGEFPPIIIPLDEPHTLPMSRLNGKVKPEISETSIGGNCVGFVF
jgi:hypothetical protein